MRRFALLLLLAGCDDDRDGIPNDDELALGTDPTRADTDADGLSDADELEAGADPTVPDTDGDGLPDGDEVAAGTDPTAADTDRDGYTDFEEVDFGSDPTDRDDYIYFGGWPYNPDKDAMGDPGWDGGHAPGDALPRFAWVDQYGDRVDVYDLAGHGRPVLLPWGEEHVRARGMPAQTWPARFYRALGEKSTFGPARSSPSGVNVRIPVRDGGHRGPGSGDPLSGACMPFSSRAR